MAAALLLAGCGGGEADRVNAGANRVAAAPDDGTTGGWNNLDPCKTLDRAKVADLLDQPVISATLTQSLPASATQPAHTAQCDYRLADGQTVQFFTRIGGPVDNRVGIDGFVKQTTDAGLPPPEQVAGIGRAAFYTAGPTPHMDFFVGADRFGFMLVMGRSSDGIRPTAPDPAWARTATETLAKAVAN